VFHLLNGRQLALYLYLSMLMGKEQICHPTAHEIANDLGLASSTMVFEAMSALEHGGFILRTRRMVIDLGSRRNVYQRPSAEYTILSLLRTKRIDGLLRPTQSDYSGRPEHETLRDGGLRALLGTDYEQYQSTAEETKTELLEKLMEARLAAA
jgi:SOS-response transcriptional repressor LexA